MIRYLMLLALCLMQFTFYSCSNDETGNAITFESYLSGDYTVDNELFRLTATLNGAAITDKNAIVTFKTGDFTTGTMTLTNIIDGHSSVAINNLALVTEEEKDAKRLTFSGIKTEETLSIGYVGYVVYGTLHLDLTITTP